MYFVHIAFFTCPAYALCGDAVMQRTITKKLLSWKEDPDKKPLIVHGARQIGKTHSIMEFGMDNYSSVAYFYFDNNPELCGLFESGISSVASLMTRLEANINQDIIPGKTLIFFDEIQSCPAALASLKRFHETAPEYHIIAAGSLLGVALNRNAQNRKENEKDRKVYAYPVGKADELSMFPFSFEEFLMEFNPKLIPLIQESFDGDAVMPPGLHEQALGLFLQYLAIGGMPEAILEYGKTKNYIQVRAKQLSICGGYARDMNKYTETKAQAVRNEAVYDTLPSQLARENKKFQYALIKSGARANDYELSLNWLEKAGMIIKCSKVNEGKEPLANYEDFLSFKAYVSDVGLLAAKSNNSHISILGRTMGERARGAMTENFVAQELKANGIKAYYWESGNEAEVDFVIQLGNAVIPIEVKSGEDVRSKSLEAFRNRYGIANAVRISARNFGFDNGIKSVPLYAAWCIRPGAAGLAKLTGKEF